MHNGKSIIKSYLNNAPELPGVYRMLDADGNILYIGKAKNLKNRLSQYTLELVGKNRIMVSFVHSVECSVTESESAAFLLEGQLIKKNKPKFNILLKDDKSFPYIKLRTDHEYPQLLKYRGKNLADGKFFGPFASVRHVDTTLLEIQKIFKLRSCSDSYFANRTRACLQYQINRCSAPCVGKISNEDYNDLVGQVRSFLLGENQRLQGVLSEKMQRLSESMEFEKAAEIRDRIKAISYVQMKSEFIQNLKDADVLAISKHNGEFCIQLFMYRSHQPCGNQAYFPAHTNAEESEAEVLASFIMQLYQNKIPPAELLLSHEIDDSDVFESALKALHGAKVKISAPKLGPKVKLMGNAIHNAELALQQHLRVSAKNSVALKEVQKLFELNDIPKRIEVYDNSHIQGAFPVGAMIVAGVDGFDKKEYRLFNIKDAGAPSYGGDDYAMMREVLTRRLKRIKSEPHRRPDLMIIDGGKGHMGVVKQVMDSLNIHVPFVCMSKGVERNSGREQFHCLGRDVFTLDKNLALMKYLQILRDEVHNFAIKSHRAKRSNAITASSLDAIPAIGEIRKKALLNYFGSFAAISDATIAELSKVEGVSNSVAKIIYEYLH
ncbi:excinuclease ABC subunit UvrC [Rickettsiaceae bacterium]|nr:excinuclease ABC subunit UvrC [Rickettsiaceae bacterium]